MNKIRQLWLPFLLLGIAILAASWFLVGVIYPNNVQGIDQELPIPVQPTQTATPSPTITRTPPPTATNTVVGLTPTSTPRRICTYSINYWRENPDLWMVENIVIGNLSLTKAEAVEILGISNPDSTSRLLQQFFAALLNTSIGAKTDEIDLAIIRLGDWLIIHPPGDVLTDPEVQEIEALILQFDNFNTGLTGPGQCLDEPPTPTPAFTATPTATNTSTPAPAVTIIPPTPTPTKSGGGKPRPTQPPPTSLPTSPPPPPTNTPKPQPTNTPKPTPTFAPPPTQEP